MIDFDDLTKVSWRLTQKMRDASMPDLGQVDLLTVRDIAASRRFWNSPGSAPPELIVGGLDEALEWAN